MPGSSRPPGAWLAQPKLRFANHVVQPRDLRRKHAGRGASSTIRCSISFCRLSYSVPGPSLYWRSDWRAISCISRSRAGLHRREQAGCGVWLGIKGEKGSTPRSYSDSVISVSESVVKRAYRFTCASKLPMIRFVSGDDNRSRSQASNSSSVFNFDLLRNRESPTVTGYSSTPCSILRSRYV